MSIAKEVAKLEGGTVVYCSETLVIAVWSYHWFRVFRVEWKASYGYELCLVHEFSGSARVLREAKRTAKKFVLENYGPDGDNNEQ